MANYVKQLGKHNFNLLAGYEYFHAFNEELGAYRGQYVVSNYPYLNLGPLEFRDNNGAAWETAYRSWFGRVMYSFDEKISFAGQYPLRRFFALCAGLPLGLLPPLYPPGGSHRRRILCRAQPAGSLS